MELMIQSAGAYLYVRDGLFTVRVRDNDYQPENEQKIKQIAPGKVVTIVLGPDVALSTAAVNLALQHNIDIVFGDYDGHPVGRVWHSKLGSTTRIRKLQLEASLNATGLTWVKSWLVKKIHNQREFVQDLKRHREGMKDYLDDKVSRLDALAFSIESLEAPTVANVAETMRGLEGTAGRLFFETLSKCVPPEHRFEGRSSRPANDLFNAFLNYCYGILYRKVEKALMIAGIDPYVGFLHRDDYNQVSMVYDFIEPYRIYADEAVFRLFSAKKVNKSHVDPLANGVALNQDGRTLAAQHFLLFLDEKQIAHKGRNQVRDRIIQLDAHAFAQALLQTDKKP
jgi:CRISPR-associated protein Cas1